MKKILFVLSILTLMSYGCNRNQDEGSAGGAGMQEEESRSQDIQPMDSENMDTDAQMMDETNEAAPSSSPSSGQGTQQ